MAWFVALMSSSLDKNSFDTNGAPYNSSTVSLILRPTKTDADRGSETGMQFGMALYLNIGKDSQLEVTTDNYPLN